MIDNSSKQYIDNKNFYNDIRKYLEDRELDQSLKDKPIPNHIVNYFLLLAKKLSTYWKFYKYDDDMKTIMISEGIYACCRYVDKFNYKKYINPFAYYTSFIYNAFLQVIKAEKENSLTKQQLIETYLQESDFNYKLVDMDDSDMEMDTFAGHTVVTDPTITNIIEKIKEKQNEYSPYSEIFTPITIKYTNGTIKVIESQNQLLQHNFEKIITKYNGIQNVPDDIDFGTDLNKILEERYKEWETKNGNPESLVSDNVEQDYKQIIKKESTENILDEDIIDEVIFIW